MRRLLIIIGMGVGLLLASRAFPMDGPVFEDAEINPALYSVRDVNRVDFLSAGASAGNNAFSLGDYSLYNGSFLTDADKACILESVPESGLDTRAYAHAGMGALIKKRIYVAGCGRAGETSTMPRDVLDLALYGNELGRTYSLDGASGEAMAVADMSLAYSAPLSLSGREFFVGARLHLIKGLAYGGVVRAGGLIHTDEAGLSGEGEIVTRTARGGSGYALDIGISRHIYTHIIIHAYILNAVSSITWTQGCKQEVNTFLAENVAFGETDLDSLVTDFHESRDVGRFTTGLAPIIGIGMEKSTRWAYLTVLYSQGFRSGAFTSGRPRISVEGAWQSVWFMDIGVGLAYESGFGLAESVRTGLGESLRVELGAGFSPLPYGSSMKQLGFTMGLSYRL